MQSLARAAIRAPCRSSRTLFLSAFQLSPKCQARTAQSLFSRLSTPAIPTTHRPASLIASYQLCRRYQSSAPDDVVKTSAPTKTVTPAPTPAPAPKGPLNTENPTQSEQRKQDWRMIWRLLENVWPKNDWNTRSRVLFGLALLIAGKVRITTLLLCNSY